LIHHVSVGTNDVQRARLFYDAVLATLGIRLIRSGETHLLYGTSVYMLSVIRPLDGGPATHGNGSHLAFGADSRQMVDEFYRVALANGGSEDGRPGVRSEYDINYYGAFVRDPDGNKIEAVTYASR
jgi:catechol 2,3-dioxygenase-like lactoylglutathione lyase family enzyme